MSAPNGGLPSQNSENVFDENFVQFPDVIEGKINTEKFLDAARGVVRMVDKFGKLFAPVKYDMQGNIEKINTKYVADKGNHSTLQDLILLETASGQNLIATDALLWLRRGLHMIQLFFDKIIEDQKSGKPSEDLVAFLKRAYKEALEPYHGWMAQQLFGVCVNIWNEALLSRMVPTRSQLLQALADERKIKDDAIIQAMNLFVVGLRENLQNLLAFYIEHSLENDAKV